MQGVLAFAARIRDFLFGARAQNDVQLLRIEPENADSCPSRPS